MSLGQLFPHGTVPSADIDAAGFTGTDTNGESYDGTDFSFTKIADSASGGTTNTCTGLTFGDSPVEPGTNPAYTSHITNGVYDLPGTTGYYGQDGDGSAVIGSVAGVAR
jgi:immune inhibitor A